MKREKKTAVIASIIFVGIYLFASLYIGVRTNINTTQKADAILVLGTRSYRGESYNPCLKARVDQGVQLYKDGYAPILIFSGGSDKKNNPVIDAITMKKIAEEQGIPGQKIITETASTSTFENIIFTNPILVENHIKSVIVVTEPFHSPRAALTAAKNMDATYFLSPALDSPCWTRGKWFTHYFLREPAALIEYFIMRRI